MRYSQIRSMDISNGEGVGISLFVQGCDKIPHCFNCFNSETWDFNGGKEWTDDIEKRFMDLINRPYIQRVSILGGEPLSYKNCYQVFLLCQKIKNQFPNKKIWIYSGYSFENFSHEQLKAVLFADILVDGEYIDELKNPRLYFRGSSNQRVIDVQKTLVQNKIVLYHN